MTDDAHL